MAAAVDAERRGSHGVSVAHGVLLREALLPRAGWVPLAGEPVRIPAGRRRYRLTPVAAGGGWCVFLGEWPGHAVPPDYAARQRLHARAEREGERVLTVFTDAAGTRHILCWTRSRALAPDLHIEEHRLVDGREARVLEMPRPALTSGVPPTAEAREGAEATAAALLRRLRRSPSLRRRLRRVELPPPNLLVSTVATSNSVEVVRGVWRALERFRVLDPRCERGDWLAGSFEVLLAVALACLERMQAWLEDGPATEPKRRADALGDFRRLIARRAELAQHGETERFAAEVVLLRCLHGIAPDERARQRVRSAFGSRLREGQLQGDECGAGALLDVRVGTDGADRESTDSPEGSGQSDPGSMQPMAGLAEEVELLRRAEAQMVRMRLRLGGSMDDLLEGLTEIRSRRTQLEAFRAAGDSSAAYELVRAATPQLEGCDPLRGFDLVRGAAARRVE